MLCTDRILRNMTILPRSENKELILSLYRFLRSYIECPKNKRKQVEKQKTVYVSFEVFILIPL